MNKKACRLVKARGFRIIITSQHIKLGYYLNINIYGQEHKNQHKKFWIVIQIFTTIKKYIWVRTKKGTTNFFSKLNCIHIQDQGKRPTYLIFYTNLFSITVVYTVSWKGIADIYNQIFYHVKGYLTFIKLKDRKCIDVTATRVESAYQDLFTEKKT